MRECMTETMYEKLGISKEVYEFGQTIEAGSHRWMKWQSTIS